MTEGTAYRIAVCMIHERGHCQEDYLIRYRHLMLDAKESRTLKGENNLFILIDGNYAVKVSSKAGVFNMRDAGINEQQHVHRGLVKLENVIGHRSDIRFLQFIPKQK